MHGNDLLQERLIWLHRNRLIAEGGAQRRMQRAHRPYRSPRAVVMRAFGGSPWNLVRRGRKLFHRLAHALAARPAEAP